MLHRSYFHELILAMPLKSWRLRLSPNKQKLNKQKLAVEILPVELWDAVFQELPHGDLLRAAAVCTSFNILCIGIYFARNGFYPASIEENGDVFLRSPLLPALQLSCLVLPITRLRCHFWDFAIQRNLIFLRELVRRSGTLSHLFLSFSSDLFRVREHAQYPREDLRRPVLSAFCDVLYEMAKKRDGPVIVCSPRTMFSCRARDIRTWRLHRHEFNRGLTPVELFRRASFLGSKSYWYRSTVRLFDGRSARVVTLRKIEDATVVSADIPDERYPLRGTIVVFNPSSLTHLYLSDNRLSEREYAMLCAVITFPVLTNLGLCTYKIRSEDLSMFLLRHVLIEELECACNQGDHIYTGVAPLISPPIAHPKLTTISVDGQGKVIYALVDALDLSPNLLSLSFLFDRSTPSRLNDLKVALRRISLRTRDTHLQLSLSSSVSEQEFDEEELHIAGSLRCITDVRLACWSVRSGTTMIPWLARLPGLTRVEVTLYTEDQHIPTGDHNVADLVARISEALPHVLEVVGPSR
ncbi:hypothetical protein C8J57DRAFT_309381 [Mycena rebaudengoi]|nr:hypothetical protein C8J57DRAFT_309381 [Mycena rebaudengoi]